MCHANNNHRKIIERYYDATGENIRRIMYRILGVLENNEDEDLVSGEEEPDWHRQVEIP
jgi:hypothetical protein